MGWIPDDWHYWPKEEKEDKGDSLLETVAILYGLFYFFGDRDD